MQGCMANGSFKVCKLVQSFISSRDDWLHRFFYQLTNYNYYETANFP